MATRIIPTIRPFLRLQRQVTPLQHLGFICINTLKRSRVSPQRCLATTATADKPPSSPGKMPTLDSRIDNIVNEISGLTLLQAADLVSALKTRLNIQEVAAAVAAAPAAAPAEVVEAPIQEKPKEKTIFNVKLESFEATSKPKVIREVKALLPNLNLIDAKKFVESVPKMLKENLPKEEAEKLMATFEKLGAKLTLE